jgi:hypothetical protein
MSKARTLANLISDNAELADGQISVAEVVGAAPTANPTFTGNIDAGDNVKIRLGDSDDLQIYHDGFNSYIGDVGVGSLIIEGTDLNLRATDNSRYLVGVDGTSGYTALYHPNGDSLKLATTSTGISVTGNATFADNGKAIFGAGSDLQIYHGSDNNSYIKESGSGSLYIDAANLILRTDIGENLAKFLQNGQVQLFNDNALKIATTTTGIDVTGTVKADSYENDEALPTVRPSLLLDFANSKTLDPRITFTRGSTATYWDGHTTTKAEENLYQPSQGNTPYQNSARSNITSGQTAPDGTSTAIKMSQNAAFDGSSGGYVGYLQSPIIGGKTATLSFYAKADTSNWIRLRHVGYSDSGGDAWFNLSTGAAGTVDSNITATITSVGNSWYRVTSTYTTPSSGSVYALVYIANADQGTTANTDDGFFVWGGQLEERSSATAYTPTTNAPVVKYQPTLQTAASGEARFDHDPVTGESKGLLIEEARTNLLLNSGWSNGFTSWGAYSGGSVKVDSAIAPDGSNDALTLSKTSGNVTGYIRQSVNVSSGTTYTLSFYAKKGSWNYLEAGGDAFGNGGDGVIFNLDTGTLDFGSDATITEVGNGWYRCTRKYTPTASSVAPFFRVKEGVSSNGDAEGYNYVLIWGAQVEAGAFPTSYIPTSGSTVTRSADDASITDMSTISPSGEGTLFADAFSRRPVSAHSSSYIITRLSYDTDNYVDLRYRASGASGETVTALGSSKISATSVNPAAQVDVKLAVSYSYDIFAAAGNGSSVTTATGTALPELTTMKIGSLSGNNNMVGTIKKIAFYPKRLSNDTLQAMTEE